MEDPQREVPRVVRELCEPFDANVMLANVDKYFAEDAVFVYPLLNSPPELGREGVKAAYKMLRVLSYGQRFTFHAVAFDEPFTEDGEECMKGFLDCTEHLKLRFIPVPEWLNPLFHLRFISRIDLRKGRDGKWYIIKQEDNIPTDFGSTELHFLPLDRQISNLLKYLNGCATYVCGSTLTRLNLFNNMYDPRKDE
ncbi:hypothetical protein BMF94_6149 [Rhodotorula taiwanensis]|uniref:SigF-like NTF2-like domain-containing protein n=1 Tax=Rhodotorula taiwanensis TaxID=741276 RepID=A0A2S5B1T0_9BASI|nr:hypothetical protein BMF94_6149 [Rhodotorula taiwanensis]